MQRKHLTKSRGSLRNKLMVASALAMAAVLATPAVMARGHRGHSDNTAEVVGALVVGAVIGGVLASSSHHDNYYRGGYSYPAYPSNYYGSYPAYSYNSYPAYPYNSGYYAPAPRYGSRVSIGVVYSNHGDRSHYYRGYSHGHDSHDYRGHSHGYDSHDDRGGQGHYYRGH